MSCPIVFILIDLSSGSWRYFKLIPFESICNKKKCPNNSDLHIFFILIYLQTSCHNQFEMRYASNRLFEEEQDQNIEQITYIAQNLKKQGVSINKQLGRQQQVIGQLDNEMDLTTGRLNVVQRKLGELLETNDAGQICTVIMMAGLCLLFTICIFVF